MSLIKKYASFLILRTLRKKLYYRFEIPSSLEIASFLIVILDTQRIPSVNKQYIFAYNIRLWTRQLSICANITRVFLHTEKTRLSASSKIIGDEQG